MVDDHSRLAYAEVLAELTAASASAFLQRAVAWFGERGVRVRGVMTDNGAASSPASIEQSCASSGCARSEFDPGGRGRTERRSASSRRFSGNGPYARIYGSSAERTAALPLFLRRYNSKRPHGSLGKQAPATRSNNLVRNYS